MLIVALETGLRLQSVQWLCRRVFDKLFDPGKPADTYNLWVNTDKVNDGFLTIILPRVRDMLLRQKADQLRLYPDEEEVCYEGREHSRFAKIVALFRSSYGPAPYNDNQYNRIWASIMLGFHQFYSNIGDIPFVKYIRGKEEVSHEGFPFSSVKLNAIYTPHSCRSTFITRRHMTIELDDLARIVGHASSRVTAHYIYPEYAELGEKLQHADERLRSEMASDAPIVGGPAMLRAKATNSALVQSFKLDRAETIKSFAIIALQSALKDPSEESSGLALLRASPMSQIIFRETHICPVGESCPAEVVTEIGAQRRCGLCPLACKSIDHLPAITAKQRMLIERISATQKEYDRMQKRVDEESELAELYDAMDADLQEFLGWRLAEEILESMRSKLHQDSSQIHAWQPELVREHLVRVVAPCSEQEFVLQRIVEANHYPSLATDRLRLQAYKLKRQFLARLISTDELLPSLAEEEEEEDDIGGFARLVSMTLEAKKLSLKQLAEAMDRPLPASIDERLLLAAD